MMHTKANKDEGQVFKWGVREANEGLLWKFKCQVTFWIDQTSGRCYKTVFSDGNSKNVDFRLSLKIP